MRKNRWCFAHQTGRDEKSRERWWGLVKVYVWSGMIMTIEAATPRGEWEPCDYAALPDASNLKVGDVAPADIEKRARRFEKMRDSILKLK